MLPFSLVLKYGLIHLREIQKLGDAHVQTDSQFVKRLQFRIFVLPDMIFSTVDCVMPDNVASLLTVIFLSLHNVVSLFMITSEYVMGNLTKLSMIRKSICGFQQDN